MAIIRITTPSIADDAIDNTKLDLGDDYTFTGTIEGAGGGIFESQLLHIQDQKSSGTDGGDRNVGIQTRDLNTIRTNEITGASLSSNQITLPAGTYYIKAETDTYGDGAKVQAYLYSVTDGSNEIIGNSTVGNYIRSASVIGRFTTDTTRVYELRQYSSGAKATNGLGLASGQTTEIYTDVQIWKVA